MQFLVIAYDGTDADAQARRAAARPAHLEAVRRLKKSGRFLMGGPIMSPDGAAMIGSAMFFDFPSRSDLDSALADDAYTKLRVWNTVTILPVRL